MNNSLDDIVILSSSPDFKQRISQLRKSLLEATYFVPGDDRHKQLLEIINAVKVRGNAAVIEYTEKFDGVRLTAEELLISAQQLKRAHDTIDPKLLKSLRGAINNVRKYQREIFIGTDKKCSGNTGVKYTPVSRAGLCIPGAAAPLPSTVIMTAVPAQVAGVKELVVVSPPRCNDSIDPVILATCYELGISEVYRIGGAQAVAALTFGTETIRPVDKIVGPGSNWVQMAKKEVFGLVGIDSIAGPSEVLIIANEKANPAWIAADMLSQAEHAPGSALLFTDSEKLANDTLAQLQSQVSELDRSEQTIECLTEFGAIVVFESIDEAIKQANFFASEHLQIQCGDRSKKIAEKIQNAGAIFIGDYTPVATGDYWAGPSHTLPTGTSARFFSALSANDFVKSSSLIEYDKKKLAKSAEDIIRLAEIEGLDAHAKSVRIRR
ncbi:MAG: histidinol dehydrogenase [Phycisphaerales bacterium]